MLCPICTTEMIDIAPELWQCPSCGTGPGIDGNHPFWALSFVWIEDDVGEAISIRFDPRLDAYIATQIEWVCDDSGARIPGSLTETLLEYLSTEQQLAEAPLPVVIKDIRVGECRNRMNRLRSRMFPSALGLKELQRT